jgi:hypothetical protein
MSNVPKNCPKLKTTCFGIHTKGMNFKKIVFVEAKTVFLLDVECMENGLRRMLKCKITDWVLGKLPYRYFLGNDNFLETAQEHNFFW